MARRRQRALFKADMNRVLVTGGAGMIGSAVVRRLLRDPAWEVRVSDQRPPPTWMRQACEFHRGDLRDAEVSRTAAADCTHVIHLAALVEDIADGIVTAMASNAGENEDFNISASREVPIAELAEMIWAQCGRDPEQLELAQLPSFEVDVQRRWPSVEKARHLLGWEAHTELADGLERTIRWLREQRPDP